MLQWQKGQSNHASVLHAETHLTIQAKTFIDRTQALWARRYVVKKDFPGPERQGVLLATAATHGSLVRASAEDRVIVAPTSGRSDAVIDFHFGSWGHAMGSITYGSDFPDPAELRREIAVTIMHEAGHFFGLSEEDLERLGYS